MIIWITGLSGAGKTTVARKLTQDVGALHVDTDAEIVKILGMSVPTAFGHLGERAFRKIESEVITAVLMREMKSRSRLFVVSLGGGALIRLENRRNVLQSGKLVYLRISCAEAARRLSGAKDRPLLQNVEMAAVSQRALANRLRVLLGARLLGYRKAHITISVTRKSVPKVSAEVQTRLRRVGASV